MHNITAIILAAGKGKRMGTPKWQLPFNDSTFLSTIIDNLFAAHIECIICILSRSFKGNDPRIQYAINPKPEKGMITSIYTGIHSTTPHKGYLIIPVDHPYIKKETYTKLVEVFEKNTDSVIRPTYHGKIGHPLIIPEKIAPLIPNADFPGGLQYFLIRTKAECIDVEVDDPGILKNINTPEDLLMNLNSTQD